MVLVESGWRRLGLTIRGMWSQCRYGAEVVEHIVELNGICYHGRSWLGRRNVVGVLVGSCMWAEAPAAGGGGEPRSIVAKQHQEGGGVAGGWKGRACSWRASANGTPEYGVCVTPCCYHP